MRIRILAASAAVAAIVSAGLVGPALAGPLDDYGVADPSAGLGAIDDVIEVGVGTSPAQQFVEDVGRRVRPTAEVGLEGVGSRLAPVDGVADAVSVEVGDVGTTFLGRADDTAYRLADGVDSMLRDNCGACAPGIGGIIGPQPVGPVGDEAFATINLVISNVNTAYQRAGVWVNRLCGYCAPGIGGPIGPVPVGPVGDGSNNTKG
ncbi:MAG TPA: hypothetical protein VNB24_04735 [Acidimicrobiales bacterium]|nr:hypothetical protein [Acidimicrobiales bacterium]